MRKNETMHELQLVLKYSLLSGAVSYRLSCSCGFVTYLPARCKSRLGYVCLEELYKELIVHDKDIQHDTTVVLIFPHETRQIIDISNTPICHEEMCARCKQLNW